MGSGSNQERWTFGAIERYQLGWITHIAEVTHSGVYQLASVTASDSAPLPRALVIETARGELWVERAPGPRGSFFVHLTSTNENDWGSLLVETRPNAGVFGVNAPFVTAGLSIAPVASSSSALALQITLG